MRTLIILAKALNMQTRAGEDPECRITMHHREPSVYRPRVHMNMTRIARWETPALSGGILLAIDFP